MNTGMAGQGKANPGKVLKSTSDFTESLNEWKWKQGKVCHIVRFIFPLPLELYIKILECFHIEFMCSVAGAYQGNNQVEDFWSGCLSDFTVTKSLSGLLKNAYKGIHFLVRLQASILQL